jgi:phosphothreonine lyase
MSDMSIHQPSSYDIQVASQEAEPPSPTTSGKGEPSAAGAETAADDSAQLTHLAAEYPDAGPGAGEPSGPQTQPHPLLGNPAANQPAEASRKAPPKLSMGAPGRAQGGSRGPGKAGRKPLALNLGLASLRPAGPAVAAGGGQSATKAAEDNKPQIQTQMTQLSPSTFSPGTNVPSYEQFQNGSYGDQTAKKNDHYNFHPEGGFTTADRTSESAPNGQFEGQKIHISVDPAKAKDAYNALAPLLFSPDSPVDKFKMTNMGMAQGAGGAGDAAANRVSEGAQFTMYLKPNPQTGEFDASHLKKIQSFVGAVGNNLQQSDVSPGKMPDSDAALPGGYASFRTEEADRTQDGAEKVKQDPVYQLLNS